MRTIHYHFFSGKLPESNPHCGGLSDRSNRFTESLPTWYTRLIRWGPHSKSERALEEASLCSKSFSNGKYLEHCSDCYKLHNLARHKFRYEVLLRSDWCQWSTFRYLSLSKWSFWNTCHRLAQFGIDYLCALGTYVSPLFVSSLGREAGSCFRRQRKSIGLFTKLYHFRHKSEDELFKARH